MALQLLRVCAAVLMVTWRPVLGGNQQLRDITDSNWEEILKGEWMIEFFAPWCPACRELQQVWAEFAEWGEDMEINIAKVDVTEQPGLSGRFLILSLPTIYHCKDGVFRLYEGPRTKEDFLSFVDEKKWQDLEPISSWLGPSSILMKIVSGIFRLSVFTRQWHSYLTEQLGMPTWGSYILFTLAMLSSGLLIGLLLVFITDFVFTSRWSSPPDAYCQRSRVLKHDQLVKLLENKWEEVDDDDEQDESEEENHGGQQELRGEVVTKGLRKRVLDTEKEEEADT
ncbi:thioredoxin-related transmembrane protein 1-like [Arapaima gigas]